MKITNLLSAVPVKFANRRLVKTLFARECKRIGEHDINMRHHVRSLLRCIKKYVFSSGAATRFLMTFVVVRLSTLKNGAQRPTKLFSALLVFAFSVLSRTVSIEQGGLYEAAALSDTFIAVRAAHFLSSNSTKVRKYNHRFSS